VVTDEEIAKARSRTIMSLLPQSKVLKKAGAGFIGLCDFHEETTPSMSLFKGTDGAWRYHCHGCGASGDSVKYIQMAKGMPFVDAVKYLSGEASTAPLRPVVTNTYSYEDGNGQCLYQVLRYSPKTFRQRRTTANGWEWCLKDVRRVLYRLPKLETSNETIYYVEGEKDVESMEAHGLLATTHAGGASAWRKELLKDIGDRPRKIVVIPDMDEPGKQLMRRVFADAKAAGHDVGFILLPKIGDKQPKDVTEWFEMGGTVEDLLKEAK
jgi:DNA primase